MKQESKIQGAKRQGAPGVLWFLAACLAAVLGWAGCFGGGIDAGVSDSQPYQIFGRVDGPDGLPRPGAVVTLYPSGHEAGLPGAEAPRTTVSDSNGVFRFPHAAGYSLDKQARYAVVVRSANGALRRMADSIRAVTGSRLLVFNLTAPRRLVVTLTRADTSAVIRFPGTLTVPGTDILLAFDGTAAAALDTLPVGATRAVLRFGGGAPVTLALPATPLPDPGGDPEPGDTLRVIATPGGPGIAP